MVDKMLLLQYNSLDETATLRCCDVANDGDTDSETVVFSMPPQLNSLSGTLRSKLLPWRTDSLEVESPCSAGAFKPVVDSSNSVLFYRAKCPRRTDFLAIIASLVDHRWNIKVCSHDDSFLLEKDESGQSLRMKKTESAISAVTKATTTPTTTTTTDDEAPSPLTCEQETTVFKQKMIFGLSLKKAPSSFSPTAQVKSVTVRLEGSERDLRLTWGSKKEGAIFVREIVDVKAHDSNNFKRAADRGKYIKVCAIDRELNLIASSTEQAFWFIKGLVGLMNETSSTAGMKRGKKKEDVMVDADLASELFGDDCDEPSFVDDSDLVDILKNVELNGEVRLRGGKTISDIQLEQIQEHFETRQGAASAMQKIVRKLLGGGEGASFDFCPEEMLSCFEIFDEDGDGFISTEELRHVLTNIGGRRMQHQECNDIMKRFDINGDGNIDYKEFAIGLLGDRMEEKEDMMKEASHEVEHIVRRAQSQSKRDSTEEVGEWVKAVDPATSQEYWYNSSTGESSWARPAVETEGEAAVKEEVGSKQKGDGATVEETHQVSLQWQRVSDPNTQQEYFYNAASGESSWNLPSKPEGDNEEEKLPPGWRRVEDETYGLYFWNQDNGETSYSMPTI